MRKHIKQLQWASAACNMIAREKSHTPSIADAMTVAAKQLDEEAMFHAGRINGPAFVNRQTKSSLYRTMAQKLIAENRKIYGAALLQTVATTLSVALAVDISKETIADWSREV